MIYVIYKVFPLQRFRFHKEVSKLETQEDPRWIKNFYIIWYFVRNYLISMDLNYYIGYIGFAILGYFNPLFSAVLLFDIFKR